VPTSATPRSQVSEQLPAHLEVASLIRRVAAAGDFATVVRRGDPDRGSLLLLVTTRGRHCACLERILNLAGGYHWEAVGPGDSASSAEVSDFVARRARFDEDLWAIELDIAEPERFIAETTAVG
jgi:hypothetical protein